MKAAPNVKKPDMHVACPTALTAQPPLKGYMPLISANRPPAGFRCSLGSDDFLRLKAPFLCMHLTHVNSDCISTNAAQFSAKGAFRMYSIDQIG